MDEDAEYVPEVTPLSDHYYPTIPFFLPPRLRAKYVQILNKFGRDIANLVIFTYKEYGAQLANTVADKILSFNDFKSLFNFLMSNVSKLYIGRKEVATMIIRFKFNYYHEQLLDKLKRINDEEVKKLAVDVFLTCSRVGAIPSPICAIEVARYLRKAIKGEQCNIDKQNLRRCKYALDIYMRLKGIRVTGCKQ